MELKEQTLPPPAHLLAELDGLLQTHAGKLNLADALHLAVQGGTVGKLRP